MTIKLSAERLATIAQQYADWQTGYQKDLKAQSDLEVARQLTNQCCDRWREECG